MVLEAKYFALNIEPEKRGLGAWNRTLAKHASDAPHLPPLSNQSTSKEPEGGIRKRKLRRTGSKVAQQGIWEAILKDNLELNDVDNPSKTVVEGGTAETLEIENSEGGLFSNIGFYVWGFTEKKV